MLCVEKRPRGVSLARGTASARHVERFERSSIASDCGIVPRLRGPTSRPRSHQGACTSVYASLVSEPILKIERPMLIAVASAGIAGVVYVARV